MSHLVFYDDAYDDGYAAALEAVIKAGKEVSEQPVTLNSGNYKIRGYYLDVWKEDSQSLFSEFMDKVMEKVKP